MTKPYSILPPTFFILGAPKCGTTSLASYLAAHPEIIISSIKEPNFFSRDLPELMEVNTMDGYLDLFQITHPGIKISGEASTWYLYSKVAVENILKFRKDAKFIVMIRNPIDMAVSLHSQQVYNLNEPINDFNAAWRLNSERRKKGLQFQDYKNCCSIGTQLERVVKLVNDKNIKIIVFDEFIQQTEEIYFDTLNFLGIDKVALDTYKSYNSNKEWQYKEIVHFVKRPPLIVDRIVKSTKKILGINNIGVYSFLEKALQKNRKRKINLTREILDQMKSDFHYEIKLLESITSKDLNNWLE